MLCNVVASWMFPAKTCERCTKPLASRTSYTERALEYIGANRNRPFFLFLSHAMPGCERVPFASGGFRGKSRNGAWGDAVEELDWSTGQILDKLVTTGLDRRTLVLWTSDNGAPLARDIENPARGSNLPLDGRGYTTAEGAFRIPSIAWWPGTIPKNSETDETMSLIDMLPTLAALAGSAPPGHLPIDGLDVSDALLGRGDGRSPHQDLFYYQQQEMEAVRSGPWKLFLPLQQPNPRHPHFGPGDTGRLLLFNVATDPGSRTDLASPRPEIVEELTAIAERSRAELADRGIRGAGQRHPGQVDDPAPAILRR